MKNQSEQLKDPCGEFGPAQKWAVVWFIAVIIFGSVMTYQLSKIDSHLYHTNAEYLNMADYKENRLSQTTIASERFDPRAHGDYSSMKEALSNK